MYFPQDFRCDILPLDAQHRFAGSCWQSVQSEERTVASQVDKGGLKSI